MLGAIYLILYILQVLLLIRSFRRKQGFGRMAALNLLMTLASIVLLWYFDTMPGLDIIPGFAYFPEVFSSLLAALGYGMLAVVSFISWLIFRKK